jgi:ferredoxin
MSGTPEPPDPDCSRREFFRRAVSGVSGGISVLWSGWEEASGADWATEKPQVYPWVEKPDFVRPPGALAEKEFLEACTRCGDCIKACAPLALRGAGPERGRRLYATPIIVPRENACVLCEGLPCIAACPTGALIP